jgi:hypothetical protein
LQNVVCPAGEDLFETLSYRSDVSRYAAAKAFPLYAELGSMPGPIYCLEVMKVLARQRTPPRIPTGRAWQTVARLAGNKNEKVREMISRALTVLGVEWPKVTTPLADQQRRAINSDFTFPVTEKFGVPDSYGVQFAGRILLVYGASNWTELLLTNRVVCFCDLDAVEYYL